MHYLRREDYDHHTALLCVQTKSTLAAPKMTFETNEFYLRDSAEMTQAFAEWPEAIASTLEIAERCDVNIELGGQLIPSYPTEDGTPERDYLRTRVQEGLRLRYGDPPPAEAVARMEMELGVIDRMGFNAYFLIVWDFVKFAKENGVAVGPGRGSAAGSIVAYCLSITDVDPLKYDLLFERFLNPERVSMPDIDIDFSVRGRERVMRYVVGEVRPRVGGSDRHLRQDVPARRHPRCRPGARLRLRRRRPSAKLIPDPQQGRPPSFEDCLAPGEAAAQGLRRGRPGAPDHRCGEGPRGHRAQLLDPRRRGGHRRPAVDRHRAAAARRCPGRTRTAIARTGRSRSSR